MAKLVLFDLDKTLLSDTKDTSEYVAESIRNIYGRIVEVHISEMEGETSQNIAETVLLKYGMPLDEIRPRLDRYMEDVYSTYYNVAGHDRLILQDGGKELLSELEKKGFVVGISTGEGERITKFKTDKAAITQFFKLGAFGNNGKDYKQIIEVAASIGKSQFGIEEKPVVITSSPYAIKGAVALGFPAIGVTNGKYSQDELSAAGAMLVVRSLKDRGKILDFAKKH